MAWISRVCRWAGFALYFLLVAYLLSGSSLLSSSSPAEAARRYTRSDEFEFVGWTLDATMLKLGQASLGMPFYLEEQTQHQIVLEYAQLLDTILQDESQLRLIYADPSVADPGTDAKPLRDELEGLYARQRQIGPLAESVLQEQISATLASLGLTGAGQSMPPVLFHMTPLPYNLIISPRDQIQQSASISLAPDLRVDRQVSLESQVDNGLGVSSLVVPVGGIGTYPTMIERTTDLSWLASTIAHEWTHNWLALRPLGLNYDTSPELRTMNETTADIMGTEVGQAMLKRYYPEKVPNQSPQSQALDSRLDSGQAETEFDFQAEMHATRVRVDELLAEGKIDEAEKYMEQRRLFFWEHGYAIRKLNQAYFAFYGAYAATPGGAAGEDPVGPAVRALRAQSSSLSAFLHRIAGMSSFTQLQAAVSP